METIMGEEDAYDHRAFEFSEALQKLLQKEKLLLGSKGDKKVVEFKHPAELKKILNLEIVKGGSTNGELLSLCETVLKHSVKTGNTRFFNQLFHGGDPYGLAATWLIEALNSSEYTYEVAPVFCLVSDYVLRRLAKMAGFGDGDGVFVPGGSMGNIMALSMARYRHNKSIKIQGMFGMDRLIVLTSEDSHYSTRKGAALLGFGMENVVNVKTNVKGQMMISDLRNKVAEEKSKGHVPICVVATSGTTVIGAFDDLEGIADVCKEHDMWMHVDSCWGGGVLFSQKHRSLLKGIERCDSFVISLHKMMGAPLQCVPLVTKHKGDLQNSFGFGATYLFQQDKFYDVSYDMGDKTIQCGRKADGLKFWLMWKAKGDDGMAAHVDRAFNMAEILKQKLAKAEGFRLVMDEFQCTNVCFWYIPVSMRNQPETEEWWKRLHMVAPMIKESMTMKGSLLIGYQPLPSKNFVNFFRVVVISPRLTPEDLEFVITEIDSLGRDISP